MIYLTNIAGNVKMGFDFLNNLSADFDITGSKFENWIPFVLNLSASGRTIAITEDMQAAMTIYEVEKIYNGLKQLLDSSVDTLNKRFTHYSNKINAYLRFIEGGEVNEHFEPKDYDNIIIRVVAEYDFSFDCIEFLNKAKQVINAAGFGLEWAVA